MAATGSTTSSVTSTSHTMTALPKVSPTSEQIYGKDSLTNLLAALAPGSRHVFIQPTPSLPDASLDFVKTTLDGFAGQLCDEQAAKQKEKRKKRKRGGSELGDGEVLKIRKVHTQGFEVEQVWEQARRVIDALRGDAGGTLGDLAPSQNEEEVANGGSGIEWMKFDKDGFEISSDVESGEETEDDILAEGSEDINEEDDVGIDHDIESDEDDLPNGLDEDDYDDEEEEENLETFVEDPHGLNDGFFSLENFNKQTEFLEQQDAAADPYTGEASDEEDIDWDADPLAVSGKSGGNSKARIGSSMVQDNEDEGEEDDDDDDDNDEEDGPTFGNMNLDAPEGDSEDEVDEDMEEDNDPVGDNTNEIMYKNFFEPPPRKIGKAEHQARFEQRQARKSKPAELEDDDADLERAIADVRRDLFNDLSDQEDSQDALSDVDPANPKSRKSAHERRQIKLQEEIRRLEALSVQKREWTLAGEARAADRPLNSLLEEDLDFERTGKPVPVITAEVTESIEELIKRRILAQEFDEVTRRRPDTLSNPVNARRGQFELDDSKPQQSLAEIYEEEHVKISNPDTYVSKADEKLRKEEKEIVAMWKEVSAKLDGLSSWHYKPKPAAPSLTIMSDVATVAMEDAQPTTAAGINGASMLAPQEIYTAGKEKANVEKGEVVPRGGAPVARQEMTREEKLRRRRREKERIRKQGDDNKPVSKKEQAKKDTIGDLRKGGVKIINKKGEIRDVDGNRVKDTVAVNGAGSFKL